jgi:two-component system response regulator YesN
MNSILQGIIEFIKGEREKRSKKRIELAKIYIEENCQNKITLNDVAEYVELNTSYFSNLFKAEVGMNFTDYLLDIRVEKAKTLLKDPKIKVYEIGNLVGYEDAVSFGRAFKKKLGMSPKEYRNTVY